MVPDPGKAKESPMKQIFALAISVTALAAASSAALAMSTVPLNPKSGTNLGPGPSGNSFGIMREPDGADSVPNPYGGPNALVYGNPFGPGGNPYLYDQSGPRRSSSRSLNIDPFDPNSVMNNYDRYRYANPFPFDPVYNPFGQSPSPYAPNPQAVGPDQGMHFGV